MGIKILVFLLCLLSRTFCFVSGQESCPIVMSMGGLSAVLPIHSVSVFSNPAWLCVSPTPIINVSLANWYGIPGLTQGHFSGTVKIHGIPIGMGLACLRLDSIYRENLLGIASAFKVSRVSFGLGTKLREQGFADESPLYTAVAYCGCNLSLFKGLSFSMTINPIFESGYEATMPNVPIKAGAAYQWPEGASTAIEIGYEKGLPMTVRFAQEIVFWRVLILRTGIRSDPFVLSMGIGVRIKALTAETAILRHPELGLCKSGGFTYISCKD